MHTDTAHADRITANAIAAEHGARVAYRTACMRHTAGDASKDDVDAAAYQLSRASRSRECLRFAALATSLGRHAAARWYGGNGAPCLPTMLDAQDMGVISRAGGDPYADTIRAAYLAGWCQHPAHK